MQAPDTRYSFWCVDLSVSLTAYESIMFHRLLPMQERSLLYFHVTWQNMLQLRVKCKMIT